MLSQLRSNLFSKSWLLQLQFITSGSTAGGLLPLQSRGFSAGNPSGVLLPGQFLKRQRYQVPLPFTTTSVRHFRAIRDPTTKVGDTNMENISVDMSNAAKVSVPAMLFTDEEVRDIEGYKRSGGDDCVEVTCGCTSHRYGDAVGCLRIFASGFLEISCECTFGCAEDKLSPAAFEKHSERESSRNWKNNIWVIIDGEKVPLYKTVLLKYYYNKTSKRASLSP